MSDTYSKVQSLQQGEGLANIIFLVAFLAIMYFFVIRPQMKRQKEHQKMLENLHIGDEVIVSGGIVGKILIMETNFIHIKISDNTQVMVQKQAIMMLLPYGTLKI